MREILFRGQSIEDNRWVYGDLIREKKSFGKICTRIYRTTNNGWELIDVDSKTVGQYTGLNDENGNKIFENDIVAYWDTYSTENGQSEADCIGKVVWDDETISFQVTNRLSAESYEVLDDCSVIGNIFDNPELLEE